MSPPVNMRALQSLARKSRVKAYHTTTQPRGIAYAVLTSETRVVMRGALQSLARTSRCSGDVAL